MMTLTKSKFYTYLICWCLVGFGWGCVTMYHISKDKSEPQAIGLPEYKSLPWTDMIETYEKDRQAPAFECVTHTETKKTKCRFYGYFVDISEICDKLTVMRQYD